MGKKIDSWSALVGAGIAVGCLVLPVVSDWFAPVLTNIRTSIQGGKVAK